jgi:glc operon protein GlcG
MAEDRRVKAAQRVMNQAIAERAVKAALARAVELGTSMSVAVVDESGTLVYFVKGDATGLHTFETARGKAVTAAAFRRPTTDMLDSVRNNPAFWASLARLDIVPGPGGYPLTQHGVLIGAIGCGGGIGEEDEQCAEAGARAVNT